MASKHPSRKHRQLADDAARLVLDNGYFDYEKAKRKAKRQNLDNHDVLPKNKDIHSAIKERRATFVTEPPTRLKEHANDVLNSVLPALEALPYKITGSLFDGSYSDNRPRIEIHLHADTVEEVLYALQSKDIEGDLHERIIRYGKRKNQKNVAVVRLFTDQLQVDILVLPPRFFGTPINPATGENYQYLDLFLSN